MEKEYGIRYLGRENKESNFKPRWITDGLHKDANAIEWAKGFARHLAITDEKNDVIDHKNGRPVFRANLSTNQLRKFFGEMKRIQVQDFDNEGKWLVAFKMLKPKLAYAVGRERKKDPKIYDFYVELERGINSVEKKEHFNSFVQMVEAIVAYHKYFEKTEKNEEYEQD